VDHHLAGGVRDPGEHLFRGELQLLAARGRPAQHRPGELLLVRLARLERRLRRLGRQAQPLSYVAVEALEQQRAGLGHAPVDARLEVLPERVEGRVDVLGHAAG
ncbi:MAG: hypothetical protein ACK56I_29915, partial [bacterium]